MCDCGCFVYYGREDLGHVVFDVLAQFFSLGRSRQNVEAGCEEGRGELIGARNLVDEQNTLPFGERSEDVHVLAVVWVGGVCEERQQLEDDDGEDFLWHCQQQ